MKKTILAVLASGMIATPSMADTLGGVYIGGHVWSNEYSGTFGSSQSQADFNLEEQEQGSYFIALEHPIPLIPNVKIASTTLDTTGDSFTKNFNLGAIDKTFNGDADTIFDVSYIDYTLYYEFFDNDLLSFDAGITVRDLDGDINVTLKDGSLSDSLTFSEFVPMLYTSVNVGIPSTGFNLYAEGAFLSYDDHSIYDYQAGISYELIDNLVVDVNLLVGYRAISLDLEDLEGLYSDLEFNGVYAGAVVHF